jgi:hypothetical protein
MRQERKRSTPILYLYRAKRTYFEHEDALTSVKKAYDLPKALVLLKSQPQYSPLSPDLVKLRLYSGISKHTLRPSLPTSLPFIFSLLHYIHNNTKYLADPAKLEHCRICIELIDRHICLAVLHKLLHQLRATSIQKVTRP